MQLTLELLPEELSICHLDIGDYIPQHVRTYSTFYVKMKTQSLISVICETKYIMNEAKGRFDHGWRVFAVEGPLELNLVGILSKLLNPLALNGISIFALSAYTTDYVLVKADQLGQAISALQQVAVIKDYPKPKPLIYFACSVSGGRELASDYHHIINLLESKYGTVLTKHLADLNLKSSGEPDRTEVEVYERDKKLFNSSHILIAHVSQSSTGVGVEIGMAQALQKPILFLAREDFPGRISPMISGNKNIPLITYRSLEELSEAFNTFFAGL